MTQIVAVSDRLAAQALDEYDRLMVTGTGPNLQRLSVRTVAQAAAIRALEEAAKGSGGLT